MLWVPSKFEVARRSTPGVTVAVRNSVMPWVSASSRDQAQAVWDTTSAPTLNLPAEQLSRRRVRAGRASGARLEWPLGAIREKRGEGQITATAPPGVALGPWLEPTSHQRVDPLPTEQGPNWHLSIGYVPACGPARSRTPFESGLDHAEERMGGDTMASIHVEFTRAHRVGQQSQMPM